ncbi:hypothetical protein Pst134EA_022831 [Puccinia striiformis f. sp. tritici]|uniref:hypothetical protein n=1 Tax=Puccinia striiformis f. sp. tritici TaxID=168172 RepID=UPI002008665E|nr:hypothetical protein Pst134EA_022831 [Puccinia striiformis f. sp. tritici]KAH9455361.1 hypothetical protein Pst134EA_022831 [Puccinia striiformis f. sp. tritici]KAI9605962.1 hypothetical protein H4Q26_004333 [Puccinia striiformis f. sp. tritici PST-130]
MAVLATPSLLLLLLSPLLPVTAQDKLVDCKYSSPQGASYDFNNLIDPKSWPLNLTTITSTPPSTTIETILVSICKKLPTDHQTQNPPTSCPDRTLVCLLIYNEIAGGLDRRLEQIIPVGLDTLPTPTYIALRQIGNQESVQLTIKGSIYNDIQQTTYLNLICPNSKEAVSEEVSSKPTRTIYDRIQGSLNITWITPTACASTTNQNSGKSSSTHTFQNFITVLVVLFFIYLIIGMWYNYSTYGLTGIDGLPHKTFWEEVPKITQEFIRNLCGSRTSSVQGNRADYTPL